MGLQAFIISAVMPSGPGALPHFSSLMAVSVSVSKIVLLRLLNIFAFSKF